MNKDLFTKAPKPSKPQQDTTMAAPQAPPQANNARGAVAARVGVGKLGHDRRTVVTPREKVSVNGKLERGMIFF